MLIFTKQQTNAKKGTCRLDWNCFWLFEEDSPRKKIGPQYGFTKYETKEKSRTKA